MLFVWTLAFAPAAVAITVRESRIAASVTDQTCTVPKPAGVFQPTARQAFLWFAARQVRAGDQLRVEWVDPSGAVSTSADYGDVPSAAELCFTSQLPIAGFAPASQPGTWTARAFANGALLFSRKFAIAADVDDGGPVVGKVTWSGAQTQETDFTVQGRNFAANPLVLIARYTASGGWTYLATLQPSSAAPNKLVVHYRGLPANEYLVIVENPDQRMSRPMPFLIETGGYKLPIAAGEPWVITQGPYGTFSHWGNSLHAYDIAPRSARCVVAMKAGIAYTHDLGLHQDHRHHSFGNYITIDHGNGEYSHYAHLQTGTFVVENGQHVEQGQALAIAGNSGYTLGEGGGYHVHVSVTRALPISSHSIPFEFEDLPDATRRVNRTVVSENASPLCDCRERHPGPIERAAERPSALRPSLGGAVVERCRARVQRIQDLRRGSFLAGGHQRTRPAPGESERATLRLVWRHHRLLRSENQSSGVSRAASGARTVAHFGGRRQRRPRAHRFQSGRFARAQQFAARGSVREHRPELRR